MLSGRVNIYKVNAVLNKNFIECLQDDAIWFLWLFSGLQTAGFPILGQIYAWHCILLYPPNNALTIQHNRE